MRTVEGVYEQTPARKKTSREEFKLFLWAMPFVFIMIAFSYVPLFGWVYAFFDYKVGIPLLKNQFVGISKFVEIFSVSGELLSVITNTLAMNFLNIIVSAFPVVFAILLNEIKSHTLRRFIQTVTTIPNFISWIIVYSLFFSIFSSEGMLNQLLFYLGWNHTIDLLGNRDATWYFQTAVGLWKTLGWSSIIYIAAIAGIDNELYDAAKVDGAGTLRRILHVTVPGIIPTYIVLLLLSIANMLSGNFDQYFVFYNSLVADKIEVLDYYSYRVGILMNDYSLGTAVSLSKSIVSIVLLLTVNKISRVLRGEALF